jgi:hypothetical protein
MTGLRRGVKGRLAETSRNNTGKTKKAGKTGKTGKTVEEPRPKGGSQEGSKTHMEVVSTPGGEAYRTPGRVGSSYMTPKVAKKMTPSSSRVGSSGTSSSISRSSSRQASSGAEGYADPILSGKKQHKTFQQLCLGWCDSITRVVGKQFFDGIQIGRLDTKDLLYHQSPLLRTLPHNL